MGRPIEIMLCGLLVAVTPSRLAAQDATVAANSVAASSAPAGLRAPERVGRYTRGEMRDFGTPELGVSYRYDGGDSTRVTAYLYGRGDEHRGLSNDDVMREQTNSFKEVLEVEKKRGTYDSYEIALDDPARVKVGERELPGWRVAYVFRRGNAVYVSFYFVYAVGDALVKVRGTMPHGSFNDTDVPEFAREFVTHVASGR